VLFRSSSNEVEKRALRDVLKQLKAGKVSLIYEPIAAALGLGLNIQEPNGKFIIDIGGGLTEISLISHSNIVAHRAIRVGGDAFDEHIQDYLFRSEEHTSELQSRENLVCRLLLEKKKAAEQIRAELDTGR